MTKVYSDLNKKCKECKQKCYICGTPNNIRYHFQNYEYILINGKVETEYTSADDYCIDCAGFHCADMDIQNYKKKCKKQGKELDMKVIRNIITNIL